MNSTLKHLAKEGMLSAPVCALWAAKVLGEDDLEELADWEPEVIEIELAAAGAAPHRKTLDAVLCVASVARDIRWRTHAEIFENVVCAMALRPVRPDIVQQAHPAEIAWTLYALDALRLLELEERDDPLFDTEVIAYTAVCALAEGMMCLPRALRFAEDEVKRLARTYDAKLCSEVKKRAADYLSSGANIQDLVVSEDAHGVQLAQLLACELYVREQRDRMRDHMRHLANA